MEVIRAMTEIRKMHPMVAFSDSFIAICSP